MSRRILRRSVLRTLRLHPWQTALAVLGVALGVAVVVGIDLANASARRAFALSTEAVTGRATHQIVGGPSGLPDAVFAGLVTGLDPLAVGTPFAAAPVVEGWVRVGDRPLRLLGVDPLSERPFRPYLAALGRPGGGAVEGGPDLTLGGFLTIPGATVLSSATAAELGINPEGNATMSVTPDGVAGREPVTLRVLGALSPADDAARETLDGLLLADISTAQEALGLTGYLTRVDLILADEAAARAVEAALEGLPGGGRLLAAEGRSRAVEEMTRSFRLNLQALALLALLCGVFLIYNTMTFSVVQRRESLGVFRALGLTRREVVALVLAEAALVGAVATALGLALGAALGRSLVQLTTRTINDLYFALEVRDLALPPEALVKGAVLGLGATLAATLPPAWEAASASPKAALRRSEIESKTRSVLPKATLLGIGGLALGALLLAWRAGGLAAAFTGLFAVLSGCALLVPGATVLLMKLLAPVARNVAGVLGVLSVRGVTASLSRTAVALAALMVAVSVTVGVGLMIDSFRDTVERWLTASLEADLYVSPRQETRVFDRAAFGPELPERLRRVPGVARVSSVRRATLESTASEGGSAERMLLLALDIDARSFPSFQILAGDPAEAWPAFQAGRGAIVSEAYAYRHDLAPGDTVSIPVPDGPRELPVVAVYSDYASDQGLVLVSRAAYDRWFDDRAVSAVSVFAADATDPADPAFRRRLEAAVAEIAPEASVRSNRALREASLEIFDRTFRVTGVLRLLAGLVAFLGVLSALLALELERGPELALLRAQGLTPAQVWGLTTGESGLMGLAAGLFSIPVGWLMAAIMIYVINRRSFGWTLELSSSWSIAADALTLSLVAALLAGLYPAWKMSRIRPAAGLRAD